MTKMGNQNEEESASTQPNQRLGTLSHDPKPTSSYQQAQKRDRPESPPYESHVPRQSPKRSKNVNPSPPLFPPIFPLEIIVEILSNLPVESLLRFRCVHKSWKSLITDPFFVKKHLQKTQNDPKFTKKRVVVNSGNIQFRTQAQISIKSCFVTAIYKDQIVNSSEIEYPSKKASRFDSIVGSCNGLICIAIGQDTIFLLNPSLRICKRLPDLVLKKRGGCCAAYGFGFDASVDDYKVVRVFHYQRKGIRDGYQNIVGVYSLRTNCWRWIQDLPFGVPYDGLGKYVDGRLNWAIVRVQEMGFSWIIVSLDLARETYMEVAQPGYGDGLSEKTLGILDGFLCVLCNYGRLYADVWVMREYGKRDSWTKLVTVPYTLAPQRGSGLFSTPLFVSESGEILLQLGAKLILYNPKENMFRIPVIHGDAISYICQAELYEESLVSPKL